MDAAERRKIMERVLAQAGELERELGLGGKPSDYQLARRWIAQHQDCRYGLGQMRQYRAGHWPVLDADEFAQSVLEMLKAAEPEGIRVTDRLLRSVISLIKTHTAVPAQRWDANPNIFVCANGTLDLRTLELREHSPNDYATTAVDYDYDPNARSPFFLATLYDAVPEAMELIQEYAGYCLTTDTSLEIALWFYGPPGTGKSTVIEGIQAALGPRVGLLSLGELEESRFALGGIEGKTLLIATEQPALFMKSAYKLNALISGEMLTVERKYDNPTVIRPTAKLLWSLNELPRADAGNGLFRRVRVVPFVKKVENPDPELKMRVASERAGILNWALEGLRRLRERGRFEIPDCVEQASRAFQAQNDIPAQFLAERCELGADYRIAGAELYEAYRAWCLGNGHQPKSSTSIAEDWQRLGLRRCRVEGRTFYHGARLR